VKFAYIILYAPDIVRTIELYERTFSFQRAFSTGAIHDLAVPGKRAILLESLKREQLPNL